MVPSAPAAKGAPRRPKLRVVRTDDRVRSVGAMGTVFALFVFATLFALAALHAVLVQTQARIDTLNRENAVLREDLDGLIAREAYFDSPDGLREAATAVGLVEATEVVVLVPVADGLLAPPETDDPFGPGVAG